MTLVDTGDIIKAYGYVFIYTANLEYSLDRCYQYMTLLGPVDLGDGEITQEVFECKGFSEKIKIIKKF